MDKYKGLQIPNLDYPVEAGVSLLGGEGCSIDPIENERQGEGNICFGIDCIECIANVDNDKHIYIEYLVKEKYITKEEALKELLNGNA